MDTNNQNNSRRSKNDSNTVTNDQQTATPVDENTIITEPIHDNAQAKKADSNEDARRSMQGRGSVEKGNSKMKKPPKKKVGLRRAWITFMIITVVVAIIVGIAAVIYFFWEPEASPVYGVNNESYRLRDRPALDANLFTSVAEKMKGETTTTAIQIEQRGGIVYFTMTVPDDRWINDARDDASKIVNAFVEASGNPDLFKKYEAQVVITKETPESLSNEALLKDPSSKDGIHAYPNFATANSGTDGQLKWSNNQ